MTATSILVVEDEFIIGSEIAARLTDLGYHVPAIVDNGEDAVRKVRELSPDVVVMDITLRGEMNGLQAAEAIRNNFGIPVIYLTAHSDDATVRDATVTEPFGYLLKPLDEQALNRTIRMALYKHAMDQKAREDQKTIHALVDAIPDGLAILDQEKKIVAVNPTMANLMGKRPDDLVGHYMSEILPSDRYQVYHDQIDELFRTGRRTEPWEEASGGAYYETSVYPVKNSDGTIGRVAIQSHDISWRKNLEEELKTAGIAKIEKNMEQFQILNDQIRNPLQAMLFYLELSNTRYRKEIEEQIRKINDLVTDLDNGWLESMKVRSFLIRNYQYHEHGRQGTGKEGL